MSYCVRIEYHWDLSPSRPDSPKALKQALCAPSSVLGYRSPVPLAKFQMDPTPSILMSSGSKKRNPDTYA
jgi:hypothetical protein